MSAISAVKTLLQGGQKKASPKPGVEDTLKDPLVQHEKTAPDAHGKKEMAEAARDVLDLNEGDVTREVDENAQMKEKNGGSPHTGFEKKAAKEQLAAAQARAAHLEEKGELGTSGEAGNRRSAEGRSTFEQERIKQKTAQLG